MAKHDRVHDGASAAGKLQMGIMFIKEYTCQARQIPLAVKLGSRKDERKIAIQGWCAETKTGEPLWSNQEAAVGDIEIDATIEVTVEQAADGDGCGATGLKIP